MSPSGVNDGLYGGVDGVGDGVVGGIVDGGDVGWCTMRKLSQISSSWILALLKVYKGSVMILSTKPT